MKEFFELIAEHWAVSIFLAVVGLAALQILITPFYIRRK
jgi:hypothetical protein